MPITPTRAERVLEERTRGAWATYALTTAGLEGGEYDEAEAMAWSALQAELRDIAADEARLHGGERPL
jgi:hypothetical protein